MGRGSETPSGYTGGDVLETALPGVWVVMVGVFTVSGWLLQRHHPIESIDIGVFLVGATLTVGAVELAHEYLHKWVLEAQGIGATIYWDALCVLPHDEFVARGAVMVATAAPALILTPLLAGVYLGGTEELLVVLAGFGLSVNLTLSTLDLGVLRAQLSAQRGARFSFESTESGIQVWVFEPTCTNSA